VLNVYGYLDNHGSFQIHWIVKLTQSLPQHNNEYTLFAQKVEACRVQEATPNAPYIAQNINVLILDVVTQWNSLYSMLQHIFEF
jgi:hypothetical protein